MSPPRRERQQFFPQEHRLNGVGEGDSTMGTKNLHFQGQLYPIYWVCKTFIFHGFGAPGMGVVFVGESHVLGGKFPLTKWQIPGQRHNTHTRQISKQKHQQIFIFFHLKHLTTQPKSQTNNTKSAKQTHTGKHTHTPSEEIWMVKISVQLSVTLVSCPFLPKPCPKPLKNTRFNRVCALARTNSRCSHSSSVASMPWKFGKNMTVDVATLSNPKWLGTYMGCFRK